jgi:L-alanine-DL-glutamate epimerase-like enolase superfamily enzyme
VKITAIETIRVGAFPNLLWVEVETDEGVTGLGEMFYGPGLGTALNPDVKRREDVRIRRTMVGGL